MVAGPWTGGGVRRFARAATSAAEKWGLGAGGGFGRSSSIAARCPVSRRLMSLFDAWRNSGDAPVTAPSPAPSRVRTSRCWGVSDSGAVRFAIAPPAAPPTPVRAARLATLASPPLLLLRIASIQPTGPHGEGAPIISGVYAPAPMRCSSAAVLAGAPVTPYFSPFAVVPRPLRSQSRIVMFPSPCGRGLRKRRSLPAFTPPRIGAVSVESPCATLATAGARRGSRSTSCTSRTYCPSGATPWSAAPRTGFATPRSASAAAPPPWVTGSVAVCKTKLPAPRPMRSSIPGFFEPGPSIKSRKAAL